MNPSKCPSCSTALVYLAGMWSKDYAPLYCKKCQKVVPKAAKTKGKK